MPGISSSTDRFNGVVTSLAIKVPCVVVSVLDLTLFGSQTVNGVAVVTGDRVLVNAQVAGAENGIYDVTSTEWNRAADWDGNRDATQRTLVLVGTTTPGESILFQCDTTGNIVIGSTAVSFSVWFDPALGIQDLESVTTLGDTTEGNDININLGGDLLLDDAGKILLGTIAGGEFSLGFDGDQTLELLDVSGANTRFAVRGGINTFELNSEQNSTSVIQIGEASTLRGDSQIAIFNMWGEDSGALALAQVQNTGTVWFFSSGVARIQFTGPADTEMEFNVGSLKVSEVTAAPGDEAAYGQFWVRDDSPNTPMFTRDDGEDVELDGGGAVIDQYNYTFDTRIATTDPGAGVFNFQSATPASINRLVISDIDANGNTIDTDIFSKIVEGWVLRVVDPEDLSVYMEFTFDSTSDLGGFWLQNIVYLSGASIPANGAAVILQLTANPILDISATKSAGSLLAYDLATNTFIHSAGRGRLTQPETGHTMLHTSDSVLRLESASRIQMNVPLYVSYISNIDALIMGTDGGHYSIHTGVASNKNLDLYADNGGEAVRIINGSTLMIEEQAIALADILTYGQLWVRDDNPQTMMFTDDDGTDFIIGGAQDPAIVPPINTFNYNFLTVTTTTDPGAGNINLNNATPASVTLMVINIEAANGVDIEPDIARIVVGSVITLRDPADPTRYLKYSVTAVPTDFSPRWLIPVSLIEGTTAPANNAEISVQIRRSPFLGVTQVSEGSMMAWDPTLAIYETTDAYFRVKAITGSIGELSSNFNLRLTSAQNIEINGPLFYAERAAADTLAVSWGQVWVRDDTPNNLMFTDDADNDFVIGGAQAPAVIQPIDTFNYLFDDVITLANPGSGGVNFNNTDLSLVTSMAISTTDADSVNIDPDLTRVQRGYTITIRDAADPTRFARYSIVGTPNDQTTYWIYNLVVVDSSSTPPDGGAITVQVDWLTFIETYSYASITGAIPIWDLALGRFIVSDNNWRLTTSGGVSQLGTNQNLRLQSAFDVQISQPFFMQERAGSTTALATWGQIWVRDDAPTTLMYTDDADVDWVIGGSFDGGGFVIDQHDYLFSNTTGMTDPGSTLFRINNGDATLATQMVVSDTRRDGVDIGANILANVQVGDVIRMVRAPNLAVFVTYTVTSVSDDTTFYTFGINWESGVTRPGNLDTCTLDFDPKEIGGGSVSSSGSPLDNQIAVFTGATDIDSNSGFTYDGTQVDLLGTVTRAMHVRGPAIQFAVHDSSGAGDSADSFEMSVQDDLMLLQGTDDSAATTRSMINMDVVTGVTRVGNSGNEIILNNNTRLEDADELRFGTAAGGDAHIVYDGTDTLVIDLITGDLLEIQEGGTPKFRFNHTNNRFEVLDANALFVYSTGDGEWIDISHDGVDGHIGTAGVNGGSILCDVSMAWESATEVISANAATLTVEEGNGFEIDLDAATGNVTITLSGGPPSGKYYAMSVKVIQDSTNRTITWAGGSFVWKDGTQHVQATGNDAVSIYTFETWDGGTIWYAAGANYS